MLREPKESEFAALSLAGEGIKQYSVIIDKIFQEYNDTGVSGNG